MTYIDEAHWIGNGYSFIEEGYEVEKAEMRSGFLAGRTLTQEEWSTPEEIKMVDELADEGVCTVTEFKFSEHFQCSRRYAKGIPSDARQTEVREEIQPTALQGRTSWER